MVEYLKRFAIMVRFDSIMKKNQLISSKYFSISNLKPSPRFFLLLLNRNQSMHIVEALVWRATQFQLFNFSERRGKSSEMETNSPIAVSGIPAFTDRILTATFQCEKNINIGINGNLWISGVAGNVFGFRLSCRDPVRLDGN